MGILDEPSGMTPEITAVITKWRTLLVYESKNIKAVPPNDWKLCAQILEQAEQYCKANKKSQEEYNKLIGQVRMHYKDQVWHF